MNKLRTILTCNKLLPMILAAAAPIAISACGGDDDGAGSGTADVTVVASTTQLSDLARNVAGDRATVVGLLAPNSDPHDYEPRPSDAESVDVADLILESGGDLDLWLSSLVESSGADAPVVTMLDSVETIAGGPHAHDEDEHADEEGEDEHADEEDPAGEEAEDEHAEEEGDEDEHAGEASDPDEHADEDGEQDEEEDEHEGEDESSGDEADPHWWQSPANAVLAVEEIRDRLIEVDSAGRTEYEANAAEYIDRLERLDAAIADCIGEIPERDRKLVTSHDSLGYFADRYEIAVVGAAIPALTTQAQPSAGATAELVDLVRDAEVKAVFPEAGVGSQLEQAIAEETGATVGGELWADTLGPDGTGAETYLDAMAQNARTLADGLSGGSASCGSLDPG